MRRYFEKRKRQDQTGATLVEFALTIGPFLLIMSLVIDTVRLVIFHLAVQHVAAISIRDVILPGPTRDVGSVRGRINNVGNNYNLKLHEKPDYVQLVTPDGYLVLDAGDGGAQDADLGTSGDLISLKISKDVKMFYGLGTYTVEGLAFGRVEPQR